jgi:hypothetical protein
MQLFSESVYYCVSILSGAVGVRNVPVMEDYFASPHRGENLQLRFPHLKRMKLVF